MQDTLPANHHSRFERFTTYATFEGGQQIRWCGTDSEQWARVDVLACARNWREQAGTFSAAIVVDNQAGEIIARHS
jgi:hypothetical protein